MKIKHLKILLAVLAALAFAFCNPPKKTAGSPTRPSGKTQPGDRPKLEPMDTIRWTPSSGGRPPIGSTETPGGNTGEPGGGDFSGEKFRIAMLLPFLTHQADTAANGVPEKSSLALQFYGGARIALEELSTVEGMNLTVDVYDTKINDAEFEKLLKNPKLDLAQIFIGPIRTSHVSALAKATKMNRKILISPESPNPDLTSGNPNFLQLNPSLKTHCEAIARFVRAKYPTDEAVLVCKQKESERLQFFQNAGAAGGRFAELVLPDATENFNNIDLKPYFKTGKTAVFIMPSWASQDFIFSFFRKIKSTAGKQKVAVFGMPQWMNFENIEADYFETLNVHLSSATFMANDAEEVRAFTQKFYDAYGTIPNDDAFNGYDATLFTGKMLKKYGLDFPSKISRERYVGLKSKIVPGLVSKTGGDRFDSADYLENKFVHILKFQNHRFLPVE